MSNSPSIPLPIVKAAQRVAQAHELHLGWAMALLSLVEDADKRASFKAESIKHSNAGHLLMRAGMYLSHAVGYVDGVEDCNRLMDEYHAIERTANV